VRYDGKLIPGRDYNGPVIPGIDYYNPKRSPSRDRRDDIPDWIPDEAKWRFEIFRAAWGSRKHNRKYRIPAAKRDAVCQEYHITHRELKWIVRRQVEWDAVLQLGCADEWLRLRTQPLGRSSDGRPRWATTDGPEQRWWRILGQLNRTHAPKSPARKTSPELANRVLGLAEQKPQPSCREIVRLLRQENVVIGSATVNRILRRPSSYASDGEDICGLWQRAKELADKRFEAGWKTPPRKHSEYGPYVRRRYKICHGPDANVRNTVGPGRNWNHIRRTIV
jgi:hypothetical protein